MAQVSRSPRCNMIFNVTPTFRNRDFPVVNHSINMTALSDSESSAVFPPHYLTSAGGFAVISLNAELAQAIHVMQHEEMQLSLFSSFYSHIYVYNCCNTFLFWEIGSVPVSPYCWLFICIYFNHSSNLMMIFAEDCTSLPLQRGHWLVIYTYCETA